MPEKINIPASLNEWLPRINKAFGKKGLVLFVLLFACFAVWWNWPEIQKRPFIPAFLKKQDSNNKKPAVQFGEFKGENIQIATGNGAKQSIQIGTQTIHIGLTEADYQTRLQADLARAKEEWEAATAKDKQILQITIDKLELKLANLDLSYQQEIQTLKTRIQELEVRKTPGNEALIDQAQKALAAGDREAADGILENIYQRSQEIIQQAAFAKAEQGKLAYDRLDYRQALAHLKRAIQLEPNTLEYLNWASLVALDLAEYDQVIAWLSPVADQQSAQNDGEWATALNNLGSAWNSKGEYDQAIAYYEKALVIFRKVSGDQHPNVATSYNNLGEAWRKKGAYDQAIAYYEKALAILRKVFGAQHPNVATSYNNLGLAWQSKGEYDQAIGYYEKALAILRKVFGDQHPNTVTVKRNLDAAIAHESRVMRE